MEQKFNSGLAALLFALLLSGCTQTPVSGASNISFSNFTLQPITYPSRNTSVHALLCAPSSTPTASVILTGGDGVTLEKLQPVCVAFAQQGLLALAHENLNASAGDNIIAIESAVDYLGDHYPRLPVALWAHSSGTIFSAFAAFDRPSIAAFVETSGHFQIPICDNKLLQPTDQCIAYWTDFPAPILIVHGEADQVVPVSFAKQLDARLSADGISHDVLLVPGAAHEFMTDQPGMAQKEAQFIVSSAQKKKN